MRIGHGYDLHRLEPQAPAGEGRPLVLGGVAIPHSHGPIAHSDGDALLHAIIDALLGALAFPDIGQLFPDTDARHLSRDSQEFLAAAGARVSLAGYIILNLDATIILEAPKLSPYKQVICQNIARMLGLEPNQVNIKGKTHEKVDAVGEGRAIEVHCVVLLAQSTPTERP